MKKDHEVNILHLTYGNFTLQFTFITDYRSWSNSYAENRTIDCIYTAPDTVLFFQLKMPIRRYVFLFLQENML